MMMIVMAVIVIVGVARLENCAHDCLNSKLTLLCN